MATTGLHAFGLTKRFRDRVVLRQVGLRVPAGEIVTVSGSPDSGKSTLLRILATDLRADAGSFYVNGLQVTSCPGHRPPLAAVRRIVGFLPGEPEHPLALTGEEAAQLFSRYYGLPRLAAAERVADLLRWAGLGALARMPIRRYSYSERRRLALVQALIHRPLLLLLDDPARGQPPDFVSRLAAQLGAEAGRGAAVLLVGEPPAGARLIHLEGGRLV